MAVADLKTKARDALRRRQYDLAIEMYLEALRFEPNDPRRWTGSSRRRARPARAEGQGLFGGMLQQASIGATRDPDKRIAACFRGLAKNPDDKGLLLSPGEAAGGGAEETAVLAYKRATEVDPRRRRSLEAAGRLPRPPRPHQGGPRRPGRGRPPRPPDQESLKLRKNLAAEGALQVGRYDRATSSRELMKDQDEARRLESEARLQLTTEHAAQEIEGANAEIAAEPQNSQAPGAARRPPPPPGEGGGGARRR